MSENFPIQVVLTKTNTSVAVNILGRTLERLVRDFDFGFRGFGCATQVSLENGQYDENSIRETLLQHQFNVATVKRLHEQYRWFILQGSMRLPDVDRLFSIDAALFPTLDDNCPACVVFELDSWLFESIYGRNMNEFRQEAADLLARLSIMLGANPLTDGFMAQRLAALEDVHPFDASYLRRCLLEPDPFPSTFEDLVAAQGRRCGPGLVTGVKAAVVSPGELRLRWPDGVVIETATGFSVLSCVVSTEEE